MHSKLLYRFLISCWQPYLHNIKLVIFSTTDDEDDDNMETFKREVGSTHSGPVASGAKRTQRKVVRKRKTVSYQVIINF